MTQSETLRVAKENCIGGCWMNSGEPCGQCNASAEYCMQSPDHQHCNDWYDGGPCHYCGASALPDAGGRQ